MSKSKQDRTISLAKALKLKNRLVGKITALQTVIRTYNSVEDSTEKFDTVAALELLGQLKHYLIDLKSSISLANSSIQKDIFELAETKADIAFLSSIPTRHGEFSQGYSEEKIVYTANIRKAAIDEFTTRLQAHIDDLQDRLDEYNAKTTIEIEEGMITAAAAALDQKWYKN